MTNQTTAIAAASSVPLPAVFENLDDQAREAFADFFTAQIRNHNTREVYWRNVMQFMGWITDQGVTLERVRPVHVAAYVELLGKPRIDGGFGYAVATVKQHLAAIRVLGAFLVVRQVLPVNPAIDVRGPRQVVRTGKTPVLQGDDARSLFDSIDTTKPAGIRDRALLAAMVYTFGRISAVLGMDLEDYYQVGRKMMLRLEEKGGRQHDMPAHHSLIEYLDAYLAVRGDEPGPLFLTINRRRTGYTDQRLNRREALNMVKRRCKAAGLGEKFTNHTFRGTGITAYLSNDGPLDQAQYMAGHASPQTTKLYDRRQQEATQDEVEKIIL